MNAKFFLEAQTFLLSKMPEHITLDCVAQAARVATPPRRLFGPPQLMVCDSCGRGYWGWFTPDPEWRRLPRGHWRESLCLRCFWLILRSRGTKPKKLPAYLKKRLLEQWAESAKSPIDVVPVEFVPRNCPFGEVAFLANLLAVDGEVGLLGAVIECPGVGIRVGDVVMAVDMGKNDALTGRPIMEAVGFQRDGKWVPSKVIEWQETTKHQ